MLHLEILQTRPTHEQTPPEPILMMPDQTQPFQIKCDASKYASGAVLVQLDINGD